MVATTSVSGFRQEFTNGLEPNSRWSLAAAVIGSVNHLKVALDSGCDWHDDVTLELVRGDKIEELKEITYYSRWPIWFLAEVAELAAKKGYIGFLLWLARSGACLMSDRALATVAPYRNLGGNGGRGPVLTLFKRLLRCGALWGDMVSVVFASSWDLKTLKWAFRRGLPITLKTMAAVAGAGNLDMVRWLRSEYCSWDANTLKEVRAYPLLSRADS